MLARLEGGQREGRGGEGRGGEGRGGRGGEGREGGMRVCSVLYGTEYRCGYRRFKFQALHE